MEINEWRPMAHWNDVFDLQLRKKDVRALDRWVAAIALDERFADVSGFAQVRQGLTATLYSAHLVRKALRCIPGGLRQFLTAARDVKEIPRTRHEFDYVEDEDYTLRRMRLTGRQLEYATCIRDNFRDAFGYLRVFTYEDERLCDPGLARAAGAIAKRRYPRRKTPKSSSKSAAE